MNTVDSLSGKTICFTGKSETKRADLAAMATAAGAIVKSSVVVGLDILVVIDPDTTSVKAQNARKQGTVIISESKFLILCGK